MTRNDSTDLEAERCDDHGVIPFVFFLALLARMAYTFVADQIGALGQFSDFLYIHQIAQALAAGGGFCIEGHRVFNQSPGYPALLAVLYWLAGSGGPVVLGLNLVLGAAGVALVSFICMAIVRAVDPGGHVRAAGMWGGIIAAFFPDSLLYMTLAAGENLLVPLMLLILAVALGWERGAVREGIIMGILWAAAASVKAHVLLWFVLIPFAWRGAGKPVRTRLAVAAGAMIVCLVPWTVANFRASGHFIPFAAVSGEVMLDGTNPMANGGPVKDREFEASVAHIADPVERDRAYMKQAAGYAWAHPAWFVKLTAKKFVRGLVPVRDYVYEYGGFRKVWGRISKWGVTGFNALLFGVGLLGLLGLRRNAAVFAAGASLVVAPVILQTLFFAYARYRFPFLFCLIPFAVAGMAVLLSKKSAYSLPLAGASPRGERKETLV